MKIIKFLLSLALTAGLIYALDKPILTKQPDPEDPAKFREALIPPLGNFVSPFTGFWQNAETPVQFVPQTLTFPNLKGKVKIVFDERLVPHIFASNLEDAVFAQGYVTASYRLWQMDMITRLSGGRLAEVLGADLLETDRLQRRRGMLYGAGKTEEAWKESPENFRLMESYAEGINAYINAMKPAAIPLEFKLLNYQPEAWTPLKSALVKKYMDLTLCFGEDDLEASNALKVLGAELFQHLFPEYNPRQTPVIPAGKKWDFTPVSIGNTPAATEGIGLFEHKVYEKDRNLVGSNNWAVAASQTLNGNSILCNDPHLRLSLPSIWFEVQIHTPELNTYGVSIPGLPGILIGFNENIAWGETNVGHDVLDWYKIKWTDASKISYELDGKIKQVVPIVETFRIRGQETPVLDTVKWTEWGPVVYTSDKEPRQDLAMHWIAHQKPNPGDIATFLGLSAGKNYEDYHRALQTFDYPAQNFVYASREGDVAITVNGKFPLKQKSQGRFVQEGNTTANAWHGWIPRAHIPRTGSLKTGYVASANQHSTGPGYPYYYNSMDFDDFRGRLINSRLSGKDSLTVEDMKALQNSNYSLHAEDALPLMLKWLERDSVKLSDAQKGVYRKLKAWNFSFDKDKIEPVLFEEWWDRFYELTFDEVLIWKDSFPVLMPEKWRLVELATLNDPIFDVKKTPEKEDVGAIVITSFQKTLDEIGDKLLDPNFDWAKHKKTSIMHLARIPAFSEQDLDVGGYRHALNAISENHGPSWRMVVELGKELKAWGVFPGGQSGNPGSRFYKTDLDKWMKGEYNELYFMKNADDGRKPAFFTIEMN